MKTEKHTRKEIIDHNLQAAGWNVADRSQVIEEFDIEVGLPEGVSEPLTPYQGHQFSDYVLMGKDAKPLAVVEAKKSSKDAAKGGRFSVVELLCWEFVGYDFVRLLSGFHKGKVWGE
jgi:type I restriction enzyme R subunit